LEVLRRDVVPDRADEQRRHDRAHAAEDQRELVERSGKDLHARARSIARAPKRPRRELGGQCRFCTASKTSERAGPRLPTKCAVSTAASRMEAGALIEEARPDVQAPVSKERRAKFSGAWRRFRKPFR